MNVLEFKNGDRVTLTALFDEDGGGNPITRHLELLFNDDSNIYADVSAGELEGETLFIQYNRKLSDEIGQYIYQYISCQLEEDSNGESFTIRNFVIKSKSYGLASGWSSSKGLYLVESFKPNQSIINWNQLPWGVK